MIMLIIITVANSVSFNFYTPREYIYQGWEI